MGTIGSGQPRFPRAQFWTSETHGLIPKMPANFAKPVEHYRNIGVYMYIAFDLSLYSDGIKWIQSKCGLYRRVEII